MVAVQCEELMDIILAYRGGKKNLRAALSFSSPRDDRMNQYSNLSNIISKFYRFILYGYLKNDLYVTEVELYARINTVADLRRKH